VKHRTLLIQTQKILMANKTDELSLKEREYAGNLGLKYGYSEAAKISPYNKKAIKRWAERIENGENLFSRNGPQYSRKEIKRMLELVPDSRNVKLKEIISTNDLKCSVSYLSNLFKRSKKFMQDILLCYYLDQEHGIKYQVVNGYYSTPYKIENPNGGPRLLLKDKLILPFYSFAKTDFILETGELIPVPNYPNITRIQALLAPKKDCGAIFVINPFRFSKHHWHVVKEYTNGIPHTYCGMTYPVQRPQYLANSNQEKIAPTKLCQHCQQGAIQDYNASGHLNPPDQVVKQTKVTKMVKLFQDAVRMGSIKRACKHNFVRDANFYNWRRKNPDLFDYISNQLTIKRTR